MPLDLMIAIWLATATLREMPALQAGDTPLVLAVGSVVPARETWPRITRAVACRAFTGRVMAYLLVNVPGEYGVPIPAPFHTEIVECGSKEALGEPQRFLHEFPSICSALRLGAG